MRSNSRVCLEVDEVISTKLWNCVIVSGRYEELPNEDQYMCERERGFKLLDKRFLWWQAAYAAEQLRCASQPSPTILYCIHVDDMTGRRAEPDQFDAAPAQQKTSG
jgi:nitroimidazol reductase NimA-like FMN-containing flavoprotein (pyridoxamine 5'-phosphate oxidase superfamily)